MIAFTHSRVIRRCVIVMLAVWGFALMAGVANACLQHERQSGHDTQVQSVDADALEVTCNDSRYIGVIKVTAQAGSDRSPLDPGAAPANAGVPHLVPVAAINQAVDDAVQSHGPPSAIRFLRLRL